MSKWVATRPLENSVTEGGKEDLCGGAVAGMQGSWGPHAQLSWILSMINLQDALQCVRLVKMQCERCP